MDTLLIMGIFWTVYGIAGLLGFQFIHPRYRGHSWTPDYLRRRGLSYLLIGIPWLILHLVRTYCFVETQINKTTFAVILIAISLPGMIYSFIMETKFSEKAEKETDL